MGSNMEIALKPTDQLVASIRELRFAINRLSAEDFGEELQPASRQALVAQAKALQADIDRLLGELTAVGEATALERDLID